MRPWPPARTHINHSQCSCTSLLPSIKSHASCVWCWCSSLKCCWHSESLLLYFQSNPFIFGLRKQWISPRCMVSCCPWGRQVWSSRPLVLAHCNSGCFVHCVVHHVIGNISLCVYVCVPVFFSFCHSVLKINKSWTHTMFIKHVNI